MIIKWQNVPHKTCQITDLTLLLAILLIITTTILTWESTLCSSSAALPLASFSYNVYTSSTISYRGAEKPKAKLLSAIDSQLQFSIGSQKYQILVKRLRSAYGYFDSSTTLPELSHIHRWMLPIVSRIYDVMKPNLQPVSRATRMLMVLCHNLFHGSTISFHKSLSQRLFHRISPNLTPIYYLVYSKKSEFRREVFISPLDNLTEDRGWKNSTSDQADQRGKKWKTSWFQHFQIKTS